MQKDSSFLGKLTGNTGAPTDSFKAKAVDLRRKPDDIGDAGLFKNAFAKAIDKLEPKRMPEKQQPAQAKNEKPVVKSEEKIEAKASEKVDNSAESEVCHRDAVEPKVSEKNAASEDKAPEVASNDKSTLQEPEGVVEKPAEVVLNEGFKQSPEDIQAIIAAQISAIVAQQNANFKAANNVNPVEGSGDKSLGAALLATLSTNKGESANQEAIKQENSDAVSANEQLLAAIMSAFKQQSANVTSGNDANLPNVKANIMQALDVVKQALPVDAAKLVDDIKEQISAAPSSMQSSDFAEMIAKAVQDFSKMQPEIKPSTVVAAIAEQLKNQNKQSAPETTEVSALPVSDVSSEVVAMKTTGNSASQDNSGDSEKSESGAGLLAAASNEKDGVSTDKAGDKLTLNNVSAGAVKPAPHAEKAGISASTSIPHDEKKVIDQVVLKVQNAVKDGVQKVSMKLNPPELGQIHVQMDIASDGKTSLTLSADTKETLALMQRNAKELERSLLDTGMKTDAGSLSFNLRGDGEQRQFFGWAGDGANDNNPRAQAYGESLDSDAAQEVGVTKRVVYFSNDEINIII